MCRLIKLTFLLLPFVAIGQNKKAVQKTSIQAVASAGIVAGESGVKPMFQLTGGISQSNYFAGIGVAYDNYRFRSLPIFADIKINFGRNHYFFAYGDLGYNIPLDIKDNNEFYSTNFYYGGVYMDLGLGFRHHFNKKNSLLFSVGYNRKDIHNKVGFTYPCFNPPCAENISYYKYGMGRIVTRLSWELGK